MPWTTLFYLPHKIFFDSSYSVLQSKSVSVSKNQGTEAALSEKDWSKDSHFLALVVKLMLKNIRRSDNEQH